MKTKYFTFAVLTLFVSALFLSLASAAVFEATVVSAPSSVAHNAGSFTVDVLVNYTGTNATTNVNFAGSMTSGSATISASSVTLVPNQTLTVPVTVTFPASQSGPLVGTITATPSSGSPASDGFSVTINPASSLSISKNPSSFNSGNVTLTITNTGNIVINNIVLNSSGNLPVGFSSTSPFSLNAGSSNNIVVFPTNTNNLNSGTFTSSVTASSGVISASTSISLNKGFCSNGAVGGNLSVSNIDVNNDGDKDEEWKPLDQITVEVDVENENNDVDIDDVVVELALFDSSGKDVSGDLDFLNSDEEQIELGDINEDDKETVTFEFIVPADFDEGSYKLSIKAYSDKTGESKECTDSSDSDSSADIDIDVNAEDDEGKFIAFDDVTINPTEAVCGESVTLEADAFNVGEDDEDRVNVILESRDFNLNTNYEIRNGLDQGDSERASFTFVVPEGLSDKTYTLELSSEYDYRNGVYRESSDESFRVPITVIGCDGSTGGSTSGNDVSISASLESDAQPGEELIVKSVIRNTGSSSASFAVDASGYDSWAALNSISSRLVDLDAGESKEITFKFTVDKDAVGERSFFIEAESGDKLERREVAVNLESGSSITGSSILGSLGDNSLIWIIGAVNVILILIIIIVAIRVSSK